MKRRDRERRRRELGWRLARHGGRHDVWTKGEREVAVLRHDEVDEYVAKSILREAAGG